jgi:hypothetical protein
MSKQVALQNVHIYDADIFRAVLRRTAREYIFRLMQIDTSKYTIGIVLIPIQRTKLWQYFTKMYPC